MSKKRATIEVRILGSKLSTAVELLNEWIRWCNKNEIDGKQAAKIIDLFKDSKSD